MDPKEHWHCLDCRAACAQLDASADGLARDEAGKRLEQYSANVLAEQAARPLWRMLFDQFTDILILVLIAAALVAGLIGEPRDSAVILVIVLLNAIFGVVQEYRAERAVAALRRMASPEAAVLRDGIVSTIRSEHLVPGDVVLLEAGRAVPADLRLLEAVDLQADESLLTGESRMVEKQTSALRANDLPLGDRTNMAFKGTLITHGRGRGLVVATSMGTELGRIAGMPSETARIRTPPADPSCSLRRTSRLRNSGNLCSPLRDRRSERGTCRAG